MMNTARTSNGPGPEQTANMHGGSVQPGAHLPRDRSDNGAGAATTPKSVFVTVQAISAPTNPDEILIPATVAGELDFPGDGETTVRAGGSTVLATARVITPPSGARDVRMVMMAPPLLSRLSVQPTTRLHLRYDADRATLSLGPFIGILALRTRRGALYGELDPFFRALTRQGKQMGIPAFMFSPSGVDWRAKHIHGYTYSTSPTSPGWRKHKYPLPDAVYDRIQTRRVEQKPRYAQFRAALAHHVPAWFNETGFFDKWRLHRVLWENERLRPLLPETLLYRSRADLEHIVKTHQVAFLKPVGGSLGLGIIRVRRVGSGFTVTYEPGERVLMRKATTFSGLKRIIDRLVRGRPYIVQQGLPLATWSGRPFDIRMLMQRTAGGAWTVTKIFSRIAAPGNITSNLSRGADPCNIGLLLRRVFGRNRARLHKQLHSVGMHCAKEIERTLPGTVGELGLDLGISRNGRIWLIEANSKPFLQMTREAGSRKTLTLSVRRPLLFAKHLTGYE